MGSSGSRKQSDTLQINRPATNADNGSGGGGGLVTPPDINNICPLKFRVKLSRQDIKAGVALSLEDTKLVAATLGEVGKISSRDLIRLQTCSQLGAAYTSIVTIIDRGSSYAEFSQ